MSVSPGISQARGSGKTLGRETDFPEALDWATPSYPLDNPYFGKLGWRPILTAYTVKITSCCTRHLRHTICLKFPGSHSEVSLHPNLGSAADWSCARCSASSEDSISLSSMINDGIGLRGGWEDSTRSQNFLVATFRRLTDHMTFYCNVYWLYMDEPGTSQQPIEKSEPYWYQWKKTRHVKEKSNIISNFFPVSSKRGYLMIRNDSSKINLWSH